MKVSTRWWFASAFALSAALGSVGCQTTEVGQVLPSGYHVFDDVQYFPRGPHFPLANELNQIQAAEGEQALVAP